jgi:hypothetical protein
VQHSKLTTARLYRSVAECSRHLARDHGGGRPPREFLVRLLFDMANKLLADGGLSKRIRKPLIYARAMSEALKTTGRWPPNSHARLSRIADGIDTVLPPLALEILETRAKVAESKWELTAIDRERERKRNEPLKLLADSFFNHFMASDWLSPAAAIGMLRLTGKSDKQKYRRYEKLVPLLPPHATRRHGHATEVKKRPWQKLVKDVKAKSNSARDWSDGIDIVAEINQRKDQERQRKKAAEGLH